MSSLQIREEDLEEKFIRSSGHGGQNINKVSTCVYLKHFPTNLEVKCQESRYQADNRYFARVRLCEKIEKLRFQKESAAEREAYEIKKQKARRSRKTKKKLVEMKRDRSNVKQMRQKPKFED